ncbi:MAG: HD domain-containing protein [Acidaminococcaceae bacterium]|nr:HD domain-containing protein [Acidaminococcaceae bacterium]
MQFVIQRTKVENSFRNYTAGYDLDDVRVKLKVDHTFRVAALCDIISDSLGLAGYDKDLAWLLGMLHDIGRFEQLRRFHTFRDALSVNHAELSADILFRDGLIRDFLRAEPETMGEVVTAEDLLLVEKAIRLHNVYQLPDDLSPREYRFATILRDADKIDILRVNVETTRSDIYNVDEEIFLQSAITDAVYEKIMQCNNLYRDWMKTPADLLLGHISFVFGLVYPVSVRLMKEQGYLEKVLQFPSRNEETKRRFIEIGKVVHAYMEEQMQ